MRDGSKATLGGETAGRSGALKSLEPAALGDWITSHGNRFATFSIRKYTRAFITTSVIPAFVGSSSLPQIPFAFGRESSEALRRPATYRKVQAMPEAGAPRLHISTVCC